MTAAQLHARARLRRGALLLLAALAASLSLAIGSAAWRRASAPRAWAAGRVPVAFWAWRAQTPAQDEVDAALRETGAHALFIRAGQFETAGRALRRIRAVTGRFPRGVELHFVYNATQGALSAFEKIDEEEFAAAVAQAFDEDAARAASEGACVTGLQLDMDVPTRLLKRYARVLRLLRERTAHSVRLSVTGLPTWMNSADLKDLLAAVDFWAPQFYGYEIPDALSKSVPISSPREVERDAARARSFGKPFYAGLAAYGHALLYSREGRLLELRGDMDPTRVARDESFELIDRRAFDPKAKDEDDASANGRSNSSTRVADTGEKAARTGDVREASLSSTRTRGAALSSDWRYVFRARTDAVVDGLVVRAGEHLLFDLPSGERLRACVRGVRRASGDTLLGILLFRLPTAGDPSTLTLAQISSALADRPARVSTALRLGEREARDDTAQSNHLTLAAMNDGEASALLGEGALTVTLSVPRGSVRGVASLEGFNSFETLCNAGGNLVPCGALRADAVRLKADAWGPGARALARLSFEGARPRVLTCAAEVRADDGRVWEFEGGLNVEGGGR